MNQYMIESVSMGNLPATTGVNMLGSIFNLFGRSPFTPLRAHMEKVSGCVHLLDDLFKALEKNDYDALEVISNKIGEFEHEADLTKNDIRNHLPKGLFLPIDRSQLLEILSTQEKIADKAKDIAVLATLKRIELLPTFIVEFKEFLQKNISTFDAVLRITKEMDELLESSFGGIEAEKVCSLVEEVSFKEHEVDIIQRKLLKKLFEADNEMSYTTFYVWQKICIAIASISNLSETLAYRIRVTLELK